MNNFEKMRMNKFVKVRRRQVNNEYGFRKLDNTISCPPNQVKQASKLDNLDVDETEELKKFIQAFCYQCEGQKQLAENLKKENQNEAYRAPLED